MPFDTQSETPFQAEAEAIVAAQREKRAQHRTGVSWSAMSRRAPEVEDVESVRQRLVRQEAARAAYRATPRARAHRALRELAELGYVDELRGMSSVFAALAPTMLSDSFIELHLGAESLLRAIRILNGIDHSTARDAIQALTELGAPVISQDAA